MAAELIQSFVSACRRAGQSVWQRIITRISFITSQLQQLCLLLIELSDACSVSVMHAAVVMALYE